MLTYNQIRGVENEKFRKSWTLGALEEARIKSRRILLDVGAGEGPFKADIQSLGYLYFSHDFGQFDPSPDAPGLQDTEWNYSKTDFTCDVLDIPEETSFDVVLCTEVLEHVPDPVATIRKLARLLSPGGRMIVTVPFLSLMHQAPFWFSSGLSPFWFDYWRQQLNLRHVEITVFGDYADLFAQEAHRAFWPKYRKTILSRFVSSLARKFLSSPIPYRNGLPENILTSGAFGVCFVADRPAETERPPA